MKLKYIGRGATITHVPARDLTDADFEERRELWDSEGITIDVLLNSGLYINNTDQFDEGDAKKILPNIKKNKKEGE